MCLYSTLKFCAKPNIKSAILFAFDDIDIKHILIIAPRRPHGLCRGSLCFCLYINPAGARRRVRLHSSSYAGQSPSSLAKPGEVPALPERRLVELGGFAPPSREQFLEIATCLVGLFSFTYYPQTNKDNNKLVTLILSASRNH